jgi:Uma2 family endonuclease
MVSLSSRSPELVNSTTQRVLLHQIGWQTYQKLLSDMGDQRSARLAYDRGILEISMPSDLHEFIKHLLERIIIALTEELHLKVRGIGSVTLNRPDLAQGIEPDSGFYIQNADRIRGRQLDLSTNPPPDLIVEVDITSSSSRRLGIYQQLQVPEIWRYTAQRIEIRQLQDGKYILRDNSIAFPRMSAALIQQFLEQGKQTDDDNEVIRSLRAWIQTQGISVPPIR